MKKMTKRSWTLCGLLLVAVGAPAIVAAGEAGSPDVPKCEDVQSIGVAWMTADGTIKMRLRALPPGPVVEGELSYKPGDRDYDSIREHLGGIAPGQSKPVRPWC